jgi:DNA-binding PadR family transcriptional regulator
LYLKQEQLLRYSNSEIQKESDIENEVKKHLEVIVLSILRKQPMCGQDIVKEIFRQYHVFISQRSVYTVLSSLKGNDVIESSATKGDLRSKVYFSTEKGSEIANAILEESVSSIEYMLVILKENIK